MKLSRVCVVIPVWQCADRLQSHLQTVRTLVEAGCSTIWVASESDDNSHQIAERASQQLGGKYFLVPKNLYEAWNKGIQAVDRPYSYISTVGESIRPEGLEYLLCALETTEAGLIFSPPRAGKPYATNRQIFKWPIFKYRRILAKYDLKVVPTRRLITLQAVSGFFCILGSMASCLFKTSVLKNKPFPSSFHHYGDTAWLCQNLGSLKIAYTKRSVADFQVHWSCDRIIEPIHHYFFLKQLAAILQSNSIWHKTLILNFLKNIRYLNRYREIRPKRWWWLDPKLVRVRVIREINCKRLLYF